MSYHEEHGDSRRVSADERQPLLPRQQQQLDNLRQGSSEREQQNDQFPTNDEGYKVINFEDDDPENPRNWGIWRKRANVAVITFMAVLSPLASSMFTPGIGTIADYFNEPKEAIVGATSGYVVMLGLGPLILAPLSETFGRRPVYLVCFVFFTILQLPIALSVNVAMLDSLRTISGFFGSVSIANGAGSLSDMFSPDQRATIFGWYLLGPLAGPTLGPLVGGVLIDYLNWRWDFWLILILGGLETIVAFIFLKESYAPAILGARCKQLEKEDGGKFTFEGADNRTVWRKTARRLKVPFILLFTQPIVAILAVYQAVVFATMYSLFTTFEQIYKQPPYNFSTTVVGLLYFFPGLGFLAAVRLLVPYIDVIYNNLTEKNGKSRPEYRLPLTNVGAVILPLAIFAFAWTVEYRVHWAATIVPTFFFGFGQVALFNTVQNYYIDAFPKTAASAVAAGAAFRSLVGGVMPLFAPTLFKALGYGWGWSMFGFVMVALAPAPVLLMRYGPYIRERFADNLPSD